jgi:thioredoxin-like negative regulator of GroEL
MTESQQQPKPRLLFFYSPTDGASRRADAWLAQVLQRRRNHETFHIHRIDVNERPELAARFRVTQTPAIYVVADNRIVGRSTRPRGSAQLAALMQPWLR